MKRHITLCAATVLVAMAANAQQTEIISLDIPEELFIRGGEVTPNGKYASLNFGMSGSAAWNLEENALIEHGSTYVSGITDDGTMVGQKDGMPVFGNEEDGWTGLYVNEGMYGMAEAVTPDGKYICGWIDSEIEPGFTQAVLWKTDENDKYYVLEDIDLSMYGHGVSQSRAIAISDDGMTVAGNYMSTFNNDNVAAVWTFDEETGEYIGRDIHAGYLADTYGRGTYVNCNAAKLSPDGTWLGATMYGNILDSQTQMQHLPFAYNLKEGKAYFYIWQEDVADNQLMDIADDGTVYCIGNNYGGVSYAVPLYGTPGNERLVPLQDMFEANGFNDFRFQENATVPVCANADNSLIILYTIDEDYQKAVHSITFGKTRVAETQKQEECQVLLDRSTGMLHITVAEDKAVMTITGIDGNTVMNTVLHNGENTMAFPSQETGIYIIKVNGSCFKVIK